MKLPILYVVATLDAFCFVLIITALNPFVLSLGGTQFYLGILSSTSALINLIWNPIVGSLSDTLGRKTVLLQCLFIVCIGNIMSALSSSLTVFFISRILTTFGTSIGVLLKALVDDNVQSQESKMAAMNKMQAIGGVCFIIAPLAGGYLSEYENGHRIVFYLISGAFVINIVLISLFAHNQSRRKKSEESFNMFKEITKATANLSKIDWPKYWDLFTIRVITDFVFTVFHFNFTQVLMTRFEITGKFFGYVFASVSIMGIGTTLRMKRLSHGCLLMMFSYVGQALSPNFSLYYLHLIPIPVSRVLFETTFTEVILKRAAPEEKGSVLSTFETSFSLAGLTAPLFSGIISDTWGINTCLLLCTIPLSLGLFVTYTQKQKINKTE